MIRRRARVLVSWESLSPSCGLAANSAARSRERVASTALGTHFIDACWGQNRFYSQRDQWPPSSVRLVVVLVGFVDGQASEIIGHFENILITLVPWRRGFINHHDALLGKAELHKTGFADVGAQPTGVFQFFITGEL